MDCQDWSTVTVGSSTRRTPAKRPTLTAGASVVRKLEADDIPKPTKSLATESRQAIVSWRVANKKTQAELNTACAFPANTIRDIEAGRLCPTPTQLNALNRVLRTTLHYA